MKVLKSIYQNVKTHFPIYLAGLLLVINGLIGDGSLNLPNNVVDIINAILVSTGLGALHIQSRSISK